MTKRRKPKMSAPPEVMRWGLASANRVLSQHPNMEGARLSALFHIQNGENIRWEPTGTPLQVAAEYGVVGEKKQFVIYQL